MTGDLGPRAQTKRGEMVQRLADAITARVQSHPVRVAIDGVDTAGKTTLADELAAEIRSRGRVAIRGSIDRFHRPRSDRYCRGVDSPEGYYFDSFNHDALRTMLLLPLGPGGNRRYRTGVFDLQNDRADIAAEALAPADAILLFDGVFLQRPELTRCWDYRIFVDIEPAEVLRRAVVRDVKTLGSADAVRERYLRRYLPGQAIYLAGVKPGQLADALVRNSNPAELELTFR